ncbi:4a-hydroxytetrahydrobiopterin dehydratase [Candidatus Roizmanbacteria bacterium RIFCSPHIGHO2_12_FULL_36_11]|nr:MAG: 4a-hydroxytetrahydrobiopterin dehydratase [Candidatus Roizmanbacteria bacterium RIFCSPHIGHO2_12_FULL_36_11]
MKIKLTEKKCVPCEGGMPPMRLAEIKKYLPQLKNKWELSDSKKITYSFKFKTFKQAIVFVNRVAELAESENHHPNIYILYNKVKIILTTHAIGGLSENDFILAAKIENLFNL